MDSPSQRHPDISTLYVKCVAMAGLSFAVYLAVVEDTKSKTASVLSGDAKNAPASESTEIFDYKKSPKRTSQLEFIKGMYGTNKTSTFPGVLPNRFEEGIPLNSSLAPDTALHTIHYNAEFQKKYIDENYGIDPIPKTVPLLISPE